MQLTFRENTQPSVTWCASPCLACDHWQKLCKLSKQSIGQSMEYSRVNFNIKPKPGELDIQPIVASFVLSEFIKSSHFVNMLLELIHVYIQLL